MVVLYVLVAGFIVLMARLTHGVLLMAVNDRDRFGAWALGLASAAVLAGGLLVLLNVGAWSQ